MNISSHRQTIQIRSDSPLQTMEIADSLSSRLHGGDLVALEGPLGSGKTCFVRGLARGLGLDPKVVSSPTFVISQEYEGGAESKTLVHIDAYRLGGPGELSAIGWSDLLGDREIVIAVEWPSRIAAELPPERIDVVFQHAGEHTRMITLTGPPSMISAVKDSTPGTPPESGLGKRVKCRTCGRDLETSAATFPFCSDRCRLSDLGRWFNESYRASRPMQADDELQE